MNKFTKTLLCTAMIAGSALMAEAFTLINPAPGSTTKVTSLGTIKLQWDSWVDEFPTGKVLLYDSSNKQVATGTADLDFSVMDGYTVTFSPTITAPGTYTAVIPANIAEDNSNPEYKIKYEVEANTSTPAEPTSIDPKPGSSITQSEIESFDQITLNFANDVSLTVNKANISFTDQNGNPVEYTLGGFYEAGDPMLEWVPNPMVTINFNENGNMPSGTYTLTCKPGTFTSPRGQYLQEVTATWQYTKTKADGDPNPLVIESALMGGAKAVGNNPDEYTYQWIGTNAVTVTPDMPVAQFIGTNGTDVGTGFLIKINHGEKTGYLTYSLIEIETNEAIQTSQCYKLEDGSFILPWPATVNLYNDKTYALEFHSYTNTYDYVENGQGARLTFKGLTEPYHFSSAKYVAVVPTTDTPIASVEDNKLTVLFSEPVKATAEANMGWSVTEPMVCEPYTEGAEFDNVWNVYISPSLLKTYPSLDINIYATGEDGLVVNGDQGWEETACTQLTYQFYVRQPRIMLTETNSHVAELNTFNVYSSKDNPINNGWMDYPYVTDANGERVAGINMEYFTNEWGDKEPYKVMRAEPGEFGNFLELQFQVDPVITKKGKYTLVFPYGCFGFGSQFDSDTSVPQSFDFYVVDYFPVTYSVDSNSVSLGQVELGGTAVLSLQPAEDWKLETLTVNGKDVTDQVSGDRYEETEVSQAINFAATFSYDGAVLEPAGADEVVSDLNLRAWSEAGSLYVAGLKEGQVVSVYTVGGSNIATTTIATEDSVKFTAPAGVYIIIVNDGNNRVALKLVNK